MSTDLTEDSVRIAIGDLLQTEWNPNNTAGYDATDDESAAKQIDVTLGTYSEDNPVPQLTLRDVSEIPEGGSGYSAIKADGTGPTQTFQGRIDVNTFVGAEDDLPENTELLGKAIGWEVHSIIHHTTSTEGGVMDPATGELLAADLACSPPRIAPDPDLPGPHWIARQEIQFKRDEDPPNR